MSSSSDDLHKFFTSPDKQAKQAKGVLSRLFRLILRDLDVNWSFFNKLMKRYLDDPRNGVANNSKDRSSHRGNLTKELRRPKMTWNVFMKGIRFLGPKWCTLTIDLGWASGRVSRHSITVPVYRRAVEDDSEFEDANPIDPGLRWDTRENEYDDKQQEG